MIILCTCQHLFSPLLMWGICVVSIRDVHFLWCWVSNQASTELCLCPHLQELLYRYCVDREHKILPCVYVKRVDIEISLIPRVTSLTWVLHPHSLYPVLCFAQSLLLVLLQFTCFRVCRSEVNLDWCSSGVIYLVFCFCGIFFTLVSYWDLGLTN